MLKNIIMKLRTDAHGFFTNDCKTYINLEVSKSSPNRKGKVVSIDKLACDKYPGLLSVAIDFSGIILNIGAYETK